MPPSKKPSGKKPSGKKPSKFKKLKVSRPVRNVAMKSKHNVSDFAGLSCSRTLVGNVTNQLYKFNTFSLIDFPRAVQVARAYQHYRITGIRMTLKPAYDTYSFALPNLQKPYFYYMIDKADAIPTTATLESLKQMGARPIRFDESPISISWRPSVLTEDQNALLGSVATQYKVSPWLSTSALPGAPGIWQPSQVLHKGLTWYMEQAGGNTTVYIDIEIQFQFKKPLIDSVPNPQGALPMVYAKLDASPDGIEGGTDGVTVPIQ